MSTEENKNSAASQEASAWAAPEIAAAVSQDAANDPEQTGTETPDAQAAKDAKGDAAPSKDGSATDSLDAAADDKSLAASRSKDKKASSPMESDPELKEMLESYQRMRYAMFALGILCVGILAASMALYGNKVIDEGIQNAMIMSTYLFVALMLFIAFGRVRPLKRDINAWKKAYIEANSPTSSKKQKKKAAEKLEQPVQTSKKYPTTPEYLKYRRIWLVCISVAVVIMLAAMVLIRMNPTDVTIPLLVLTSSYIFLAIAVYLELKKMKPLREAWKRDLAKKKDRSGKRNHSK